MRDLSLLQISHRLTIADAFKLLNANKSGIVFVTDGEQRVVGVVTDGDIRRHLLRDSNTEAPIETCMNREFVHVSEGAPREQVLKLLDHRIRAVPSLDARGRLHDVYTRERFVLEKQREVYTRARSPVRISFGGGGTDLTRYFMDHGGVVMNAAISLYAHAALRKLAGGSVRIYSHDLQQEVVAPSVQELGYGGALDLVIAVVKLIEPDFGFELQVGSECPVGSGLGGSAVVASAVIGCFNQFREDRWSKHQIAEMAFQAERLQLDIPGGWQDQYATVFGGFNFMQFGPTDNIVLPLRLEPDVQRELEASLVLCYTGRTRNSGDIHRRNIAAQKDEAEIHSFTEESKALTIEMKRHLLRGRLSEYGRLLHESWMLKRRFSPEVTSPETDALYETALQNGAAGGRLLGAGGGGYFLLFARPFARYRLAAALQELGYHTRDFTFDECGLQSWTVRAEDGGA